MADNTPKLGLPFMSTAQVQKELTFNELAAMVDTLVGLKVESIGLNAAPGAPDEGDAYIVGTAPTGVWAGKAKNIAFYIGGWHFIAPDAGWMAWNIADSTYYRYNVGTTLWTAVAAVPIENLVELLDVAITAPGAPEDGQAVVWDNTSGKFVLQAVAINLAGLGDIDLTGLEDGYVLAWDAGESKFLPVPQTAAPNFTSLSDTPAGYTDMAGYAVVVNATEDGLEFVPIGEMGGGSLGPFTGLTDVPLDYVGAQGRFLRVTDTEDGLEFADVNEVTQGVPAGGETDQVLRKTSDDDFQVEWTTAAVIRRAPLVTVATENSNLEFDHEGSYLRFTFGGAKSLTVRPASEQPQTLGGEWVIRNVTPGDLTLVEGDGVTINPPKDGSLIVPQRGTIILKNVGANEYDLMGLVNLV